MLTTARRERVIRLVFKVLSISNVPVSDVGDTGHPTAAQQQEVLAQAINLITGTGLAEKSHGKSEIIHQGAFSSHLVDVSMFYIKDDGNDLHPLGIRFALSVY